MMSVKQTDACILFHNFFAFIIGFIKSEDVSEKSSYVIKIRILFLIHDAMFNKF